jgi:sugar (pentulose or hexulose) kinase
LSTQGGVTLLLDQHFHALYPAVSWLDVRASEIVADLSRQISVDEIYRLCGFPSLGRQNFSQIVWFRKKRRDLYRQSAYFGSVADYLNHRLTGRFAVDISNLAHNSLLDMDARDYSERLLDIAGLSREQLPQIVPSGKPVGALIPDAAAQLGLSPKVLVVSGAHDQYCASIGAGAVTAGDCVLSAGTAWALLATAGEIYFDDQHRLFPGIHALEGKYGLMATVSAGGNSLAWFRDVFAPGTGFHDLDQTAMKADAGSGGLTFIPRFFSRSGKGAFIGIDTIHGLPHFARAVMEGVAVFSQLALKRMHQLGLSIEKLIMIGGGAGSALWPHMVADMAQRPVFLPEQREAPCAGAAALAMAGAGVCGSVEEASRRVSTAGRLVEPDARKARLSSRLAENASAYLDHI